MMEILLKNNVFVFYETNWIQNVGAAMGCKPVPPYANIFMAQIDEMIRDQKGVEVFLLLKKFLDDYFTLFEGSTKDLHALFVKMNQIHPAEETNLTKKMQL